MSTQKYQNYIAGEWIDGAATSNDINPSDTSDVVAEYAQADKKQTETAIEAARAAASAWATFGVQARADLPNWLLDSETGVYLAEDPNRPYITVGLRGPLDASKPRLSGVPLAPRQQPAPTTDPAPGTGPPPSTLGQFQTEPELAQLLVRARGNLSIWERDGLIKEVETEVLKVEGIRTVYSRTQSNPSGEEAEDVIGVIFLEFEDWCYYFAWRSHTNY